MKKITAIILVIIIVLGCQSNPIKQKDKSNKIKSIVDTVNAEQNKFVSLDSIEARSERRNKLNYSFLNQLLDSSLKLVSKKELDSSFNMTIDTNAFHFKNMYAKISFGNLFSENKKHLLIKRFINEYFEYETSLYSDIFLVTKDSLKKVAADTNSVGYNEDYFEDVNRDGYKDFIIQSYSGTGCCPRNVEIAFLYVSRSGGFEINDFFNREQDSTSQVFFETSYGYDYDISLFKYKWRRLKKILLEEIYVTGRKPGGNPHPTSYTQIFHPQQKKQIIKHLPKDFEKLKMAEYISPLEK